MGWRAPGELIQPENRRYFWAHPKSLPIQVFTAANNQFIDKGEFWIGQPLINRGTDMVNCKIIFWEIKILTFHSDIKILFPVSVFEKILIYK